MNSEPQWTHVIEPDSRVLDFQLRELWHYRDLVYIFVWRDFVAQFKQTILGPAWHIIQPLLTTVTFTLVFGHLAGISTEGVPAFLFYLAGTVMWGYFSGVLAVTSTTFTSNAPLFGKVYFPRLVVPVSVVLSKLLGFTVQFTLFLGMLVYFIATGRGGPVSPNVYCLLLPLQLLIMAALGLGLGLMVSALTTKYRDLGVVVSFGVQLLMFATPVIYPLSAVPEAWRPWIALNPIAPVMEWFRYAFLGSGTVSVGSLIYSAVMTVLVVSLGILMFNKIERTFMDTV
jgi:lipopolysaccharide transport system permease protein